jgi:hypothetical protein
VNRSEIIDAAKQLVLTRGPSNVLEFGPELDPDAPLVVIAEAQHQAERVYTFLGYDSPWKRG